MISRLFSAGGRGVQLICLTAVLVAVTLAPSAIAADIVRDGKAQAQIVIADQPTRLVKLAARELQTYVQRISGATLPIVTTPAANVPVTIYVGQSTFTDQLGVTAQGLHHDAYRMKAGDNWLVLIGKDHDYTPPEPWARSRADIPRMNQEWDKLTSGRWNNPVGTALWRQYNKELDLWDQDQAGSLNAVYGFLRSLGVRWYMPGELGEIVPQMKTIALPSVDQTVKADYDTRVIQFFGQASASSEDILWYMRLGLNHGEETLGPALTQSHGLRNVHGREETKTQHPEYYALYNGVRDTTSKGEGKPCLSSPGLFDEAVRYARAVFDIYDLPMLSVGPQDGYAVLCQCELCVGKSTPERGPDGELSDYVWDFVNRVAIELYKTHPDKLIVAGSYGKYTLPPLKIEKLSPNIGVHMVHVRGKHFDDPAVREEKLANLRAWREKVSTKVLSKEHYVFTHRGTYTPVYFPHAIAQGLAAIKDDCLGEHIEVAWGPATVRGHGLHSPAFNHLNIYLTARLYWDATQDVDAMLDEYYRLFYGQAASQMKAFIDFCEANWETLDSNPAESDKPAMVEKIDHMMNLLNQAQAAATEGSDSHARIAQLVEHFKPMLARRELLAQPRQTTMNIRLKRESSANITLDGKLDDAAWTNTPVHALQLLSGEGKPAQQTTARFFWEGDRVKGSLWVGVRCDIPPGQDLSTATTKDGDPAIWNEDHLELLIETPVHAYYQIAVNTQGAVVDLDRANRAMNRDWSSQAQVAVHREKDHWSLEMRIPVSGTDTTGDPLNDVIGRAPTSTLPWYINLGRYQPSTGNAGFSVLTAGKDSKFHDVLKFARIHMR